MDNNEITPEGAIAPPAVTAKYDDEKNLAHEYDEKDLHPGEYTHTLLSEVVQDESAIAGLELTGANDLEQLEARLDTMSLERTAKIVKQLLLMHTNDQNFPGHILDQMRLFLSDPNIFENPEKHADLVHEMKLEALLATENSPYIEVRGNVSATDDPNMYVSTVRAWVIGCLFSAAGTFIDNLFAFRNPGISVGVNVAQLVSYPVARAWARLLPDWRIRLFGQEICLNPGPFNKKEHMLITIMCNVSFTSPYTNYIIPVQALDMYFNESFAYSRGYQFLITFSSNMVGYGFAGILRKILVYPSTAIWPASLSTVALVTSFHDEANVPVRGPFNKVYSATREKIFLIGTVGMFIYYFFPGFIFEAMSLFSWMTWIAPNNIHLDAVTGITGGLGLNPWPTFDWNMFGGSGLYLPTFVVLNMFGGVLIGAIMTLGIWYRNTWNTGYLPINSNETFDNTGASYNVTVMLNDKGGFDEAAYRAYSQPWFSAGYLVYNIWAFAQYSATLTYVILFHRHEVTRGYKGVRKSMRKIWASIRRRPATDSSEDIDDLEEDVHYRLMQAYKEVPDWHYAVLLIFPIALGMVAVGAWPTHSTPAALVYGMIMPIIGLVPIGMIQAVTGISVALNIIADIIGGTINAGNANGLMFFKCWAYISSWQAIGFCSDMKLAHYLKIPPRVTFWAQLVATFIFSLVSSMSFNFIMSFPGICTEDASFRLTCPAQTSFYTASIFWGTISPKKLFGPGQRYNTLLIGFPLGFIMVVLYWGARRFFPKSEFVRQIHPVMIIAGPVAYAAPYNLAYYLGNVYVNLISFQYIRKRYVAFWAKWNYVISAAFSTGIAIAAIIMFFALEMPKGGFSIDWWGNNVVALGCEGEGGCARLPMPDAGYFGPAPGTYT
ncbi:OPT oligopeptide transporter protein-domain-containing protein [Naematelia encephala]|uniref:OPT oligopeptide transporter protein-domain-containing protein n=1 Tax=Naematelia encephala TaxID=71784 RepID=A0A1Y2AMH0_9TREE|nr:OPT oligopeptide transporter protein-domain-containing protein [Naematelia encephala]